MREDGDLNKIRVWDLPTRLFHWALALLVIAAVVFEKIGGDIIVWHFRCGYAVLTLVLFRVLWGLVGARYARFSSFRCKPADIAAHVSDLKADKTEDRVGHNPLGSLSILAMLGALLLQASTGLWSNDDIENEGPLAQIAGKALSDKITWVHTEIGATLIYILVGLHVAAIAWYYFKKKRDLVTPMISGDAHTGIDAPAADDGWRTRTLALVLVAACALTVYWVVNLPS
jgi:cytochrome b